MRISIHPSAVKLWLSANDTYEWSHRDGASWPGSQLSGSRLMAEFDSNGLVDYSIDGKTGVDVGVNEFNAITADFLALRLPVQHPAFFIAVRQYERYQSMKPSEPMPAIGEGVK